MKKQKLNSISKKWIRFVFRKFPNLNLFRISDLVLRISRHYGPAVVVHSGAPVAKSGYSVAHFGDFWAYCGAPRAHNGAPNPPKNPILYQKTKKGCISCKIELR